MHALCCKVLLIESLAAHRPIAQFRIEPSKGHSSDEAQDVFFRFSCIIDLMCIKHVWKSTWPDFFLGLLESFLENNLFLEICKLSRPENLQIVNPDEFVPLKPRKSLPARNLGLPSEYILILQSYFGNLEMVSSEYVGVKGILKKWSVQANFVLESIMDHTR